MQEVCSGDPRDSTLGLHLEDTVNETDMVPALQLAAEASKMEVWKGYGT